MVALELLGALEYVISKATRSNGTYKKRNDGTTRAFGGVNLVMFGDMNQLELVTGTWLCCNPIDIPAGRALDALKLFWEEGPNTIRRFWSLTQLMRCKDMWYNDLLQDCRFGRLTQDNYCFMHGLSTFVPAQKDCKLCNDDVVADPVLGHYKKSWADALLGGCADLEAHILDHECVACNSTRTERKRVFAMCKAKTQYQQKSAHRRSPMHQRCTALMYRDTSTFSCAQVNLQSSETAS